MVFCLFFWLVACPVQGQPLPKKDLPVAGYHLWAKLWMKATSEKGNWISYSKTYDSKMDTLVVMHTQTKQAFAFPRGHSGLFAGEKWFACLDAQRQLVLTDLKSGTQLKIDNAAAYAFTGHKIIIQCKDATGNAWLIIKALHTNDEKCIEGVTQFSATPLKNGLLMIKQNGSVDMISLKSGIEKRIVAMPAGLEIVAIEWNQTGTALTFATQQQLSGDLQQEKIWHYNLSGKKLSEFLTSDIKGLPEDMKVSVGGIGLHLSDDGQRVFFGIVEKVKPDTTGEVQIWNTADRWIYPDRRKNDWGRSAKVAMWEPATNLFRQLSSKDQPQLMLSGDQKQAVTFNPMQRQKHSRMYEKTTFYITDLKSGEKNILLKDQPSDITTVIPSPAGKYMLYFSSGHWGCYDIAKRQHINLTANLGLLFHDSSDNQPGDLQSYGFAGWSADDKSVFVYDEFDVWEIIPGKSAKRLTNGRQKSIMFRIASKTQAFRNANFNGLVSGVIQTDKDIILEAFNRETMDSGLYLWSRKSGLNPLIYENAQITYKGEAAGKIVFMQQRFDSPPELKMLENTSGKIMALVQSNPQHFNYHWGRAELIPFKSKDGKQSKATLYYPAHYDPSKKYQMVVNIYQQWTDELNLYENPTEFNYTGFNKTILTTGGYFVLQPDITYGRNNPGHDALEYVIGACDAVIAKGIIDPKKIGLFGHSFGGYETNFIITQTDRFATAVSGASIADLTRFYLSVDFSLGYSQAYHFENQQWRMEKSLFEDRAAYDRNNPINFVQNATTPLMSWTGDKDDHADWQQSIEFHLALRRLGKQNTLLVYPGDDHTINDPLHQQDLTRKVREWFGYYLKGEKAPDWITPK